MIISYDQEVDALYIRFQETTVTTKHLAAGLAADYDSAGHLEGIEILDVSKWLPNKNTFRQVTLEDIALFHTAPNKPAKKQSNTKIKTKAHR